MKPRGGSRGPLREPAQSERARATARTRELRIDSLAAGGEGVGRLDQGAVVFVGGAAPGDRVAVSIDPAALPLRGKLLKVLEAGPSRVAAPCAHVGRCGGCDWMHLSDAGQRAGHVAILEEALARALPKEVLPPVVSHAAARALRYRTRARFHFEGRGDVVLLGFHGTASRSIADVDACVALAPDLDELRGDLRRVLAGVRGGGEVQAARGRSGKPVVCVDLRGEAPSRVWSSLEARVASGAWDGAELRLEGVAEPARFGDARGRVDGADGQSLVIAPGSFAQPSDEGAIELARRVDALARASLSSAAPRRVVELFAGSGTFSVLLARGASSFLGVEIVPAAVEAARENLRARGLTNASSVKVREADADCIPIPASTSVVVLDPPRTGAPGAVRAIVAAKPRAVVYVACDPVTLARDLAILTGPGGFVIEDLETFELFPQTSHVETVARLTRRGRAS